MTYSENWVWTEERIQELIRLVTVEAMSFSAIARTMGAPSRNVPLCKFNRLREKDPTLQHPHAPTGKGLRVPRPRAQRAARAPAVIEEAPKTIEPMLLDGQLVPFERATDRMCRFPIGDPLNSDFHVCGHAPKLGSSYCESHHKICYNKPVVRVREPRVRAFNNHAFRGANRGSLDGFEH